MNDKHLHQKAGEYLEVLCRQISNRPVGSEGNRKATDYFEKTLNAFGWNTVKAEFDALDWHDGGASLTADGHTFQVLVSPYSRGCSAHTELIAADRAGLLSRMDARGKILLLHGDIAKEQLMPKNFVFYNPEHHQKTVALLEQSGAAAIVCATGRNASLAGGVYPFPLIEDGDFDVPSVYMTEEEGARLLPWAGRKINLESSAERIPAKGFNVSGSKGPVGAERIVITAHIDAKNGTPGAIDNATGVTILLLLAELLQDYEGSKQLELVAFNGEDYYSVPGQMKYIADNHDRFDDVAVNINIDGAGYHEGHSSFSFFNLPEEISNMTYRVLDKYDHITEGIQWVQGDHSIFLQYGRPAIAISSDWFIKNIDIQDITHTPKDKPEIVDNQRLVEITHAINDLIQELWNKKP